MGDNVWKVSEHLEGERLFGNRISLDLSENIHLHFRDLRVVFGKEEWGKFVEFINSANNWCSSNIDYEEGKSEGFVELTNEIPKESKYFNGDVYLEEQANGLFHFHFHDFRFEFTREVKDSLVKLFLDGEKFRVHNIGDLLVTIYDETISTWRNIPIQDSPVFKSLFDNFPLHDQYMGNIISLIPDDPNIVTTDQFKELEKSILEKGFNFEMEPKAFIEDKLIRSGHHRLSILLKMFGPEKKVITNMGYLVGMK